MAKRWIYGVVLAMAVACGHSAPSRAWNTERAASYLDQRAEEWLSWPTAQRGEGDTQTACLCCHTVVPYVMARPLLGSATSASSALVAGVRLRVESFARLDTPPLQLMYDFNEQVKLESRGTEAVLNAVVLAFDDAHRQRREPSPSTRLAFEQLWQTQTADGSWEWLSPQFELEPWESQGARYLGAAMALLALGVAPGDDSGEPLERARGYLRDHFAEQNLHNQLWALWASAELGGVLTPTQRESVMASAIARQNADGGWSLSSLGEFRHRESTASDGYGTGLTVHIVRRAIAGAGAESRAVERGLSWLRWNQTASGAWRADSVNKPRDASSHSGKFMSDAATAFAVLALQK